MPQAFGTRPFQPGQKVSPAYRKCECFVILTEAIWTKVRSTANRVGTCAIFVTGHPRLKRMRTTFLKPSPMSGKLNWGSKFLLMYKSFERKGLHSTATEPANDFDALSLIGCISVLEVFRLNRKVVCYRHSLPLHDFRRLACMQFFLSVDSVLPVRLKWGCGHSSSNVEKTVQDVAIHVPVEK